MLKKIAELEEKASREIEEAKNMEEIKALKVRYFGKKGALTALLRRMGELAPEQRPLAGKKAHDLRNKLEELLDRKEEKLREAALAARWEEERIDVTLPGAPFNLGRKHPLTMVLEEITGIFTGLGFQVARGPEIESDYYNFEALNIPPDHPARDMQDSFYFSPKILLRTHTSPVQIRTMELQAPRLPVRIIVPGKVYRRDDDATHSPMFHQVEGLAVDRGVTFADLKGTLLLFAREMFDQGQRIRLRPSFFPFTEPSAEVDIACIICRGEGCRVCGQSGWLEILGCGMVHPRVLEVSGYDPEDVTGFAFGMGVERIAMLKYGIDDLRLLFSNDLRFLRQFR
ncbi:MAG: phenylalanine--tRNA ligase subunit alpha [Dethiobacteria bacterium]|jgi:phenylalanyl-tRNA synthetase alpha chain|nr:phenylalanine--tRNA ligase subunit alpha [Bacillota bacterium]NMD32883.1 phenylalanine--tRNA ligase subunit alpha [Bacillota bacterium]HOB28927.1 phenylalanine--tRNA ligase subunit alpha [Bacillota bacterium]HPZ41491.1 phenylalanine--tRNA ligase subunit alpha [Bacillota bacterium]HQD52443.1 phenylalanine--tRNA ligase subunit alpha [Bacillota bacterium]